MTKNTKKTRATNRPKRTTIGTRRVLSAEEREGFNRRFVNDTDDRIQRFLDAGYTFVEREDADTSDLRAQDPSKMGKSRVRKSVGNGVNAFLMEIPQEWYDEGQALKRAKIEEIEASIDPKNHKNPTMYGEMKKE